jgi:hypothetical protein
VSVKASISRRLIAVGIAVIAVVCGDAAWATTVVHSISTCQRITSAGFYELTVALSVKSADCIDINANNVTLDLHGFNVSNTGTAVGTVGVNVLSTSTNVTIEGANAFIEGFAIGVQTGPSTTQTVAEDINVVDNTYAGVNLQGSSQSVSNLFAQGSAYGVQLRRCTKCIATNINATDNSVYGCWMMGSQSSQIFLLTAVDNTIAGIYEGCAPTAPGASCDGNPTGSGNEIYNSLYQGGEYGVAVDGGETTARVYQTSPGDVDDGESKFQLYDGNASCGSNVWFDNVFSDANQACIN